MSKHESTQITISAWFGQRLPEEWVAAPTEVSVDREEITVVLALAGPGPDAEASEAERAEALAGYVARWRSDTRAQRISIAREAEHRFERKVAWGVRVGEHREVFTHLAVPVMTRLRQGERQVLDTLVDAGVARSRAHALAWCVRLVGENTQAWLGDLREAMESVAKVRQAGPGASAGPSA
ncbi:MAG: hypothetical protein WAL50_09635 [Kineosporiaceae bacterium]